MNKLLLKHESIEFEHQTILITGNAFFNCRFDNCTLMIKGFPFILEGCAFSNTVWAFDIVISDADSHQDWSSFMEFVGESVLREATARKLPDSRTKKSSTRKKTTKKKTSKAKKAKSKSTRRKK